MIKNLLPLAFLFLSGCILYVADGDSASSASISLSNSYVECTDVGYPDLSEWYFEIQASSLAGTSNIVEVGFYLDGYTYQYMDYYGNGVWYRSFWSTYYNCADYYMIEFVAVDYYGYETYYVFWW